MFIYICILFHKENGAYGLEKNLHAVYLPIHVDMCYAKGWLLLVTQVNDVLIFHLTVFGIVYSGRACVHVIMPLFM